MGNTDSSLAMVAVSRKIFLKKVHILLLRYAMNKFSDDLGMISREGFDKARTKAKLTKVEVFDLLFTIWDNAKDRKVSCKAFCVGISPLACASGDLSVSIDFALRVSDDSGRKHIRRKELHHLLTGINSTASYFGDVHLNPDEIVEIVEMVLEENVDISHEECRKRLLMNAYVKRFASGKARACVRFRDKLEQNFIFDKEKLVTEYILDDIDLLVFENEKENVAISHRDPSSPRDNTDNNRTGPPSVLRYSPWNSTVGFAGPSNESETRDEILGAHGNSMTKASDSRDPPPTDKYSAPKLIETSYSTYRTPIITSTLPRIPRDPSPRMSINSPTILR